MKLTPNERKVITFLAGRYSEDMAAYSFAPIMRETGLDRAAVRRACRSLRRKGPELETALTKNETERGYKRRVVIKPRDEIRALESLAERVRKEGPCPVSDRLKATLLAKPFTDAAE